MTNHFNHKLQHALSTSGKALRDTGFVASRILFPAVSVWQEWKRDADVYGKRSATSIASFTIAAVFTAANVGFPLATVYTLTDASRPAVSVTTPAQSCDH
jgi:hypothetical protein